MGSATAKKASITLPSPLEADLKRLAKRENRTLSGVIQEAGRYYLNIRRWEDLQRRASVRAAAMRLRTEDDVNDMIHRSRK